MQKQDSNTENPFQNPVQKPLDQPLEQSLTNLSEKPNRISEPAKPNILFLGNKCGTEQMNHEKVSEIIHKISKDSEYYKRKQEREKMIQLQAKQTLQEFKQQFLQNKQKVQEYEKQIKRQVEEIEKSRQLNRI